MSFLDHMTSRRRRRPQRATYTVHVSVLLPCLLLRFRRCRDKQFRDAMSFHFTAAHYIRYWLPRKALQCAVLRPVYSNSTQLDVELS